MVEPFGGPARPRRSTAAAGASKLARQAQEDAEGSDVSSPPRSSPPPTGSPARPYHPPSDSPQKVVKKGRASYGGSSARKAKAALGSKGKGKPVPAGASSSDEDGDRTVLAIHPPTSSPSRVKPKGAGRSNLSSSLSPPPSTPDKRRTDRSELAAPPTGRAKPDRATSKTDSRPKRSAPEPAPLPPISKVMPSKRPARQTANKQPTYDSSSEEDDRAAPAVASSSRRLSVSAPSPKRKANGLPSSSISSPTKKLAASKLHSSQSSVHLKSDATVASSSSQSSVPNAARKLSRTSSLVFGSKSKSMLPPPIETKWNLRELKKIVWVRLAADGGLYADGDDARGSFWWPAKRDTPDEDLSRVLCDVRLFQPGSRSAEDRFGSPLTIHNLSSANITNLFTADPPRLHFDFSTFSVSPQVNDPSTAAHPRPSSSAPTPHLASIDQPTFDAVVRLARIARDQTAQDELNDSDDLMSGDDDKPDIKANKRSTDTEPRKLGHMAQARADVYAQRRAAGELSGDEDDGPLYAPDDKEKSRVFVFDDHRFWGAHIIGAGVKKDGKGWVYPCELVHGKHLPGVREDKIVSRAMLSQIHDKPWGAFESQIVATETIDDNAPIHRASTRPPTPEPPLDLSAAPAFEDLVMWEQLVRCRPILERIIKGDYPPAVKAHRDQTSFGGQRLNMGRDSAGYGSLSDTFVSTWIVPELQRWASGTTESKVDVEGTTVSQIHRPCPVGDEAYESMDARSKTNYISGFLTYQTLIELCMLEHHLRDPQPATRSLDAAQPSPPPAKKLSHWDESEPASPALVELMDEEKASASSPDPSLSTLPSSLATEPLQPASTATEPNTDNEMDVDAELSRTAPGAGEPSAPAFDATIEYESPFDYFPPGLSPPPTADQLAQAANEIRLFKLARAKFEAEEPEDPFWWVRPEYSLRVNALDAAWRNRNRKRQEQGMLDEEESALLKEAREQGMALDHSEGRDGEEGEDGAEKMGLTGPRSSKTKAKGLITEEAMVGPSGRRIGVISKGKGKGQGGK